MNHFFAYINRMRFIQRWSLMRNSYTENIQEHSHQVAVLAHALAVIRNELFGGQVDAGQVAAAALYHDAPEILTGDMPTPVKYKNERIHTAYKALETESAVAMLGLLPPALRQPMAGYVTGRTLTEAESRLLKAADRLSARDGTEFTITFFKHASLAISVGGKYIYIDPVSANADYGALPKADICLLYTSDAADE